MPLAARTRSLQVELPEEAFLNLPWDPETLSRELRVLFLVERVRRRQLSAGKAAELAEMRLAHFVLEMGRHGVSPFDYDPGELEREAGRSV